MKDFEYYTDRKLLYPNKKDFATTYWYHKGSLVAKQDPSMRAPKFYDDPELFPCCVKEVILDTKALHEAQNAYMHENEKLRAEFKEDLFVEFGVTDHPKANLVWEMAWEYGHSSGYQDVYNYFGDFVRLIL